MKLSHKKTWIIIITIFVLLILMLTFNLYFPYIQLGIFAISSCSNKSKNYNFIAPASYIYEVNEDQKIRLSDSTYISYATIEIRENESETGSKKEFIEFSSNRIIEADISFKVNGEEKSYQCEFYSKSYRLYKYYYLFSFILDEKYSDVDNNVMLEIKQNKNDLYFSGGMDYINLNNLYE